MTTAARPASREAIDAYLDEMRGRIGRRLPPLPLVVEAGAVRKFLRAIGDEAGADLPDDALVVPPAFVSRGIDGRQMAAIFDIPSPFSTPLHTDDIVHFRRDIRVGDRLSSIAYVSEIVEKERNGAPIVFFTISFDVVTDAGEAVADMKIVTVEF